MDKSILANLRRQMAISRAEFGRLIGYSGIHVYMLETGRRRITDRLIARLKLMAKKRPFRALDFNDGSGVVASPVSVGDVPTREDGLPEPSLKTTEQMGGLRDG